MPDGGRPAAFDATFSDFRLVKTRSACQLVFEVPIERADAVLAILGGVPQPGKEVSVAVARLTRSQPDATPAGGFGGPQGVVRQGGETPTSAEGRATVDALGDGVAGDTQADRSSKTCPKCGFPTGPLSRCADPDCRAHEASPAPGDGVVGDPQADRSSKSDVRREAARDAYWNAEPEEREVKDAGMLCNDIAFCEFIITERLSQPLSDFLSPNEVKAIACRYVRDSVGGSRSNIAKDPAAMRWWQALRDQFGQKTGRFAEARG